MKKYCIFDMDGTLVDSMGYWRELGVEYLKGKGISEQDAAQTMKTAKGLRFSKVAQLFLHTYHLPGTWEEALREMYALMEQHYRTDIKLKAGIVQYLERLREQGCHLCVATATEEQIANFCLERLGIRQQFEFLLSCKSIGIEKEQPDIYLQAAERLGSRPEETAVFEDALYAAETAKRAGFYTVAVWDETQRADWDALRALADETIIDWEKA